MKNFYYVAGAIVLALAGLGIYASQAQNNDVNPNNEGGVLIIEEDDYAINPGNPSAVNNAAAQQQRAVSNGVQPSVDTMGQPNPAANNVNNRLNNNPDSSSDFKPLPGDPGVDVAPDNQPVVDKAMKNQNPSYNQGIEVQEDVLETAN